MIEGMFDVRPAYTCDKQAVGLARTNAFISNKGWSLVNLLTRRTKAYLIRRSLQKGSMIFAGSMIQGFAMAVFLFPHAIPSGGAAGLAVLLNYWFQLPMSIGLWLMNFLFLITSIQYLGKISAVGTIGVITTTAVSVNFFEVYFRTPFENIWLDLLTGSIFLGLGITLLLKQRVSNGGIGFVALALSKQKKIDPGKALFWMNGFIFLLTAVVINWQIVIQALLCQWLSTRIVSWLYRVSFPPVLQMAWRNKRDG